MTPDDRDAAGRASAARKTIWVAVAFAVVSFAFQFVIVGFMVFVCAASENSSESAIARCHANESGRWYAAALAIPPFAILVGGLVAAARRRRVILLDLRHHCRNRSARFSHPVGLLELTA